MIHFGKALEAAWRRIRTRLLPSYRQSFARMAALGMEQRQANEPLVVFDFHNPAIDSVGGRYYYSLVRDFIDAGYFPLFVLNRATVSNFTTSRMKSMLLKQRVGSVQTLDDLTESFVLLTDREGSAPKLATRTVVVNYEQRVCAAENEIGFPVFVHPQLEGVPFEYDVNGPRSARLFFGGNTEEGKYDKNVIRDVYRMLTRRDMLQVAAATIEPHHPKVASDWLESSDFHPYVLCETQHCKIPRERWLEALSKADFFLACPGVGMPLCHNLVEAMAAGGVPVLQYADYLPDPLTDHVNCIAFDDAPSLRAAIEEIEAMSPAQVLELRANVKRYYDDFLAPGRLASRLAGGAGESRVLLLNSYRVPR